LVEKDKIAELTGAEKVKVEYRLVKFAAMLHLDPLNQSRAIELCTACLKVRSRAFKAAVRLEEDKGAQRLAKPEVALAGKPVVEPWPEPMEGAELLEELRRTFKRFMVLPGPMDIFLALWTLHTYVFDLFSFTPYLLVRSPESRCGKSRLAELLGHLCANATTPGAMTAAAMFRRIDRLQPTILADEWDTIGEERRLACINILNTGFKFNGSFTVCVGKEHEDHDFKTYCPKAIFGLSEVRLPEATRSRCFSFTLHKKLPTEKVEKLTRKFDGVELRRKCVRWAADNREALSKLDVEMPKGLEDREEDISEPLIAVAERCGADWPKLARDCILGLCHKAPTEDRDARDQFLTDVQSAFRAQPRPDRISSAALVDYLNGLDERPWGGWNDGRGINHRQVAAKLKPYGVQPRSLKSEGKVVRGYRSEDFEQVFARYLPPGAVTFATDAARAYAPETGGQ
jgi:putative DNA primase/helicase